MNEISNLNDLLVTEIKNQSQYNYYAMLIQNPELRQFLLQLRDSKMQQITQLQEEIKKAPANQ